MLLGGLHSQLREIKHGINEQKWKHKTDTEEAKR